MRFYVEFVEEHFRDHASGGADAYLEDHVQHRVVAHEVARVTAIIEQIAECARKIQPRLGERVTRR